MSRVAKTGKPKYNNPICPKCGVRVCGFIRYSPVDGRPLFRRSCYKCTGVYETRKKNPRPYSSRQYKYKEAIKRKIETLTCEHCGFKAKHRCQLDVDHIDGNRNNNDSTNLQVLCANCHRLKTQLNSDWEASYDD